MAKLSAEYNPQKEAEEKEANSLHRELITVDYAAAIRIDPLNVEAHLGKAQNHYEIAEAFSPYRNLSADESQTVNDNFELALSLWKRVTQIDPSNSKEAYGSMALVHALYGRSEQCAKNFAQYESLERDHIHVGYKDMGSPLWQFSCR